MLMKPNRIQVPPDGELARILSEVGETSVLLEKDGKLYRLSKEDVWAGYDPEKARAILKRTAGSWADVDADEVIADIHRARKAGSRPDTRA